MSSSPFFRGVAFRHPAYSQSGVVSILSEAQLQEFALISASSYGSIYKFHYGDKNDKSSECFALVQNTSGVDRLGFELDEATLWVFTRKMRTISKIDSALGGMLSEGQLLYWRPVLALLIRQLILAKDEVSQIKIRSLYGAIRGEPWLNSMLLFAKADETLASSDAFRRIRQAYRFTPRSCRLIAEFPERPVLSCYLDGHGNVTIPLAAKDSKEDVTSEETPLSAFLELSHTIQRLSFFEEVSHYPPTKKSEIMEIDIDDERSD